MLLLKLLSIFGGIDIKEHILQLTLRENALVIHQRSKPKLFLGITVHAVVSLPMWTYVCCLCSHYNYDQVSMIPFVFRVD